MPQIVNVPGMGPVEFPDGMTDEQITAAIQQNLPKEEERGPMDMLTGETGERYQTWPERLVRGMFGAATEGPRLMQDVYEGKTDPLSEEGVVRAGEAASIGVPINPAVRAGDRAIPGVLRNMQPKKTKVPTAQELREAGAKGFDEFRDSGLKVDPSYIRDWAARLEDELSQLGQVGTVAKKTHQILKQLRNPPEGGYATAADLHALRRAFGEIGGNFAKPTDQKAANLVRQRLDEFIAGLPEEGAMAGSPSTASRPFQEALGNYAAAKRSERVTGARDTAELRAAIANSGQNLDNATRQRLAAILANPKQARGYSKEELGLIETVARGSKGANAARGVGNFLGGGGGLGALVTSGVGGGTGAIAGGPLGAAVGAAVPPMVGAGSKRLAAALTRRGVNKADKAIRSRSPLFKQRADNPEMKPAGIPTREALVRAILLGLPEYEQAN